MPSLTVMDNIPMDVIRYHIFPMLDFESRINLNQCLPPSDRVSKKFEAAFLQKHQRDICVSTIKSYLISLNDMATGDKKYKLIKKMFKVMQTPIYMAFIKQYDDLRYSIVEKVIQMRDPTTYYGVTGSLEVKVALINEAKKLQLCLN
jgi:hypothetical protein